MNAPLTRYLGVHLQPVDVPRDYPLIARAITAYFEARGVVADRVSVSTTTGHRESKVLTKLPGFVTAPTTFSLSAWRFPTKTVRGSTYVHVYLRPFDVAEQRFQTRLVSVLWATEQRTLDEPLVGLLRSMAAAYPLAQGCVGSYRSRAYAGHEVLDPLDNQSELDGGIPGRPNPTSPTVMRLHWDQMHDHRSHRQLRRLYPVTIIGPQIWAQLPPMPAFDPMPTIEDLGDCKLLTAWPELCEPRDPEFLRGTRALRAWLWPYTIQNPADHVDNDPP